MQEKSNEAKVIYFLIFYSNRLYKKIGDHDKKYLGFTLSNFSFWNNIEIWGSLFVYFCEKRAKENEEKELQGKMMQNTSPKKGLTIFKGIGKAVGDMWSTKIKKRQSPISQNFGNFYEGAMEDVSFSMLGLDIDYELAVGILMTLMLRYGIDKTSVTRVFELQEQRKYLAVNQQKMKRKEEAGKWGKIYHVRMAVDYLNPNERLMDLLLVCKEWHLKLRRPLMRLVLYNAEGSMNPKRLAIWDKSASQLSPNSFKKEEQNFLSLKDSELCLAPAIETVISVDVQRSFIEHKAFDHKALTRILRRTAHFHRESYSYYQGMNYIAGFLLIFFKEEKKAYIFFNQIMQGLVHELLKNDFAVLYKMFYQFDRLVSIFCPHITAHFNVKI